MIANTRLGLFITIHRLMMGRMSGTPVAKETKLIETLVTRDEAAKRMCISVIEFRRRQRMGDFVPAKKGLKGEWLFRLSDIELAREKRLMQKDNYTPEMAALVFKTLEEGKTAIQCVIEHAIPPKAMEEIMLAYASLKECIFIKAWTVNEINKLPLDGPFPLRDENDVLVAFRTIADEKESPSAKCLECGKRERQFCKPCVKKALDEKLEAKVAEEMTVGKEESNDEEG